MRLQDSPGEWASGLGLYRSKFVGTHWMLLVLSDLGLGKANRWIETACNRWMERHSKDDGGFGFERAKESHLCITGNMLRALVKFGYADHPRVRSGFGWLVENQKMNGGWNCWGKDGVLDGWEGMSAFAVYPRAMWKRKMNEAVAKGAEFYLKHEVTNQGQKYEPWYRLHYPVHYFYDVLVGLDFMTALGYGSDSRLQQAVRNLIAKRAGDGRWNLDAVHPDVEGSIRRYYREHPAEAPKPFALEKAGNPSKMITLRALVVLKRLDSQRSRGPWRVVPSS